MNSHIVNNINVVPQHSKGCDVRNEIHMVGRGEAKGIDTVLKGLAATITDDHALLMQGLLVVDAIYASLLGRTPLRRGPRAQPR